ncbi:MAG: hypothetical protein MHM6MM_001342 [Cercozoa sp. M6MM]
MRRVVLTGIGMVTPLGATARTSWETLCAGGSGIDFLDFGDEHAEVVARLRQKVSVAARAAEFDAKQLLSLNERRGAARFALMAQVAARQALQDAGLHELSAQQCRRTGVSIGSGMGGVEVVEESAHQLLSGQRDVRRISPFYIPLVLPNTAAGLVSIAHNLQGPNLAPATACASGAHAIGDALRVLQRGECDIMLAGGAEAALTPLALAGFAACKALSPRVPRDSAEASELSCPFDRKRDGFVAGEGAAVVVLETLENFQQRRQRDASARVICEVAGFGAAADASHLTSPKGDGAALAMSRALADSQIESIDRVYLNAHATSTPTGDVAEVAAARSVLRQGAFCHTAPRIGEVAVASTKGATGHLLGAAGAMEAAFSALCLQHQLTVPTRNLVELDPEIAELAHDASFDMMEGTDGNARSCEFDVAISNSFGFGGTNTSLVLRRFVE